MTGREFDGRDAVSEACPDFADDLSAWVDGELDAEREGTLRAHLASCTHCEEAVAALRGVDVALAGVPLPEVSDALHERLMRRLAEADAQPPALRRSSRRPWLAPALALAASLVVYVAITSSPWRSEEPVDVTVVENGSVENAVDGEVIAFEEIPEDELAVVLELDTIEDYEVIANLEMLERLVAMGSLDGGAG